MVSMPKPLPVVAAPPPPPLPVPLSVAPVEPESDELESVSEEPKYDGDDADFASNDDSLSELDSSPKGLESPEQRVGGPPPPVAPALKKSHKAKKKGR